MRQAILKKIIFLKVGRDFRSLDDENVRILIIMTMLMVMVITMMIIVIIILTDILKLHTKITSA